MTKYTRPEIEYISFFDITPVMAPDDIVDPGASPAPGVLNGPSLNLQDYNEDGKYVYGSAEFDESLWN